MFFFGRILDEGQLCIKMCEIGKGINLMAGGLQKKMDGGLRLMVAALQFSIVMQILVGHVEDISFDLILNLELYILPFQVDC